jgi:uncharacterized protein (TIGR02996 family)
MSSHPDADSFMRAILHNPAELTTRLVFADWLEETGEPSNVAWARYIRLMAEAAQHQLDSIRYKNLDRQASDLASQIHATLTIGAAKLVGNIEQLEQLLPKPNVRVQFVGYEIPKPVIEYVPESVARENLVLPLHLEGQRLFVAIADAHDYDTIQKLQFILNKDIVVVVANPDHLLAAINWHYGQTEVEYVDSVLVEFADAASPVLHVTHSFQSADSDDAPVVRLVNLIMTESINIGATGIRLLPATEGVVVQFRVSGNWINRDTPPARLWRGIATRIAIMAAIPVEALFEKHPTVRSVMTLHIRNTVYSFRVSAGERIDGLLIELDKPAQHSTT